MIDKRLLWGILAIALLVPLLGSSQMVLVGRDLHNFLSGLQGGSAEEFYHVNLSEHTELTDWVDDAILYDNGNISIPGNMSAEYFLGQPLAGSIGSGIINSSSNILDCGCINVSDDGVLNATYPAVIARIWNYGNVGYCIIPSDTVTVVDNQHSVYYVNNACGVAVTTWSNYFGRDINPADYARIFDVYAIDGDIEVLKGSSVIGLVDRKTMWNNVNCGKGGHLAICDGFDVQENAFPELNQTAGNFMYVNTVHTSVARESAVNGIHIVTHSGGDWTHLNQSGLNLTHCDDDTDHVACSDNKYRRHVVYSIGFDAEHTTVHQLAPLDGETYANVADCLNIDETPLSFTLPAIDGGVAVVHHVYCGRRDDADWTGGWIDIRVSSVGFGAAVDTSIFVTIDGTTPLNAPWNAGYAITSPWFNGLLNCSNIMGATTDLCTIEDTDTNCSVSGSCPTVVYADGSVPLSDNWPVGGYNITGVDTLNATTLNQDGVSVWDHGGGIPYSNVSFADQGLNQADSPTHAGMSVDNINIDGSIIKNTAAADAQLFGQNQTTLGVGISTRAGGPSLTLIGNPNLWVYPATDNYCTLIAVPKGSPARRGEFVAFGTDFIADSTNYAFAKFTHDGAKAVISTAKGGTGVAGDLQLFGQGQTTRGIAVSDDGSHPSIKTVGANTNLDLQPISGLTYVDSYLVFRGTTGTQPAQSIGMNDSAALLIRGGDGGTRIEDSLGSGITIAFGGDVTLDEDVTIWGAIIAKSITGTGGNEGTAVCFDANDHLCVCGSCA